MAGHPQGQPYVILALICPIGSTATIESNAAGSSTALYAYACQNACIKPEAGGYELDWFAYQYGAAEFWHRLGHGWHLVRLQVHWSTQACHAYIQELLDSSIPGSPVSSVQHHPMAAHCYISACIYGLSSVTHALLPAVCLRVPAQLGTRLTRPLSIQTLVQISSMLRDLVLGVRDVKALNIVSLWDSRP